MLPILVAVDALTAARRQDLPIPAAVADAEAVLDVVDAVHPRPATPTLPADPVKARRVIEEYAAAVADAAHLTTAAADFAPEAQGRVVAAAADAVPGWLAALPERFDRHVEALRSAARQLPTHLDRPDRLPAAQHATWQAATTTARTLDALVADRLTIGQAGGEVGGQDRGYAAVAVLPPPTAGSRTRWQAIAATLTQWRGPAEQAPRWLTLTTDPDVTVALAGHGELTGRLRLIDANRDAMWAAQAGDHRRLAQVIEAAEQTHQDLVAAQ